MIRKEIILGAAILIAAGCERAMDEPYVTDGPRTMGYQTALASCKALADNYKTGNARGAAMVGGALGGTVGALDPSQGSTNVQSAAAGAALGALVTGGRVASDIEVQRRNIVIRCMNGRGFRVVG